MTADKKESNSGVTVVTDKKGGNGVQSSVGTTTAENTWCTDLNGRFEDNKCIIGCSIDDINEAIEKDKISDIHRKKCFEDDNIHDNKHLLYKDYPRAGSYNQSFETVLGNQICTSFAPNSKYEPDTFFSDPAKEPPNQCVISCNEYESSKNQTQFTYCNTYLNTKGERYIRIKDEDKKNTKEYNDYIEKNKTCSAEHMRTRGNSPNVNFDCVNQNVQNKLNDQITVVSPSNNSISISELVTKQKTEQASVNEEDDGVFSCLDSMRSNKIDQNVMNVCADLIGNTFYE